MFKITLSVCVALGVFVLPGYADDVSCTPKSTKPADLVAAINCLQKRIMVLESAQKTVVHTNDQIVQGLVHMNDMQGLVRKGEAVSVGFDSGRCLAFPSGVGGAIPGTPIQIQQLTLLQDCGGAPKMSLR